jgi:hypothetical protein
MHNYIEQCFSYVMARTRYFQWNDDVRLILDQHALFDFYSVSSLNQQSVGRHVASPRHIILIPNSWNIAQCNLFSPWHSWNIAQCNLFSPWHSWNIAQCNLFSPWHSWNIAQCNLFLPTCMYISWFIHLRTTFIGLYIFSFSLHFQCLSNIIISNFNK